MYEMKRLAILLLTFIPVLTATAQITHTAKGQVDANAEKILKKAYDKLNGGTVSFTVTMVNKNADKSETARMEADVLYNKGKYRVSFDGNTIYCDGAATWHWNRASEEVIINKMSTGADDLMNPAALLSNYKKNFNAKYIRTEQSGNAVIDLTPRTTKSYYKIRLYVNATTGTPVRMELHNYDSSSGEYHITNFKTGQKSADSDFAFPQAKHPDVEIIDMR